MTLELDDIQGNVLAGFNTDHQVLAGLTAQEGADWKAIAKWLSERAPEVTSVTEVRGERTVMKLAVDNTFSWLCIAVSERLMRNSQPDAIFSDQAFRTGMPKRAAPRLGDRTPQQDWKVGGPANVPDVLLIIASNSLDAAEQRASQLVADAGAVGLAQTYLETGIKLEGREHFGFRDGVSQPTVIGSDEGGEMEAGYFVYGYPRVAGGSPVSIVRDPRNITKNGSLLVFRRLEQDVSLFREFCAAEATRMQSQGFNISADHLQALLVGRWPKGALVSFAAASDPGQVPDENSFDFSNDFDGKGCPFSAHIRKVNPRNGPRDVSDPVRFLRRGIPFGPPFEDDAAAKRGLLFLSFQTDITNTFEFITSSWMNSQGRPAMGAGHDLLVGRALPARTLTLNSPGGDITISDGGKNWITPTGGAYLFAPGKAGLAKFGTEPVVSLANTLARTVTEIADFFAR